MLFLAVALFGACGEDTAPPERIRPEFREGQWWMYDWSARQTDSAGTEIYAERDTILVQVISTTASLDSTTGLVCVEAYSIIRPSAGRERVWYRHTGERLEEVAYQSAQVLPIIHMKTGGRPRPSIRTSYVDPSRMWDALAPMDSILWRDEPRIVLQYPLEVGSRWTAFASPFQQTRQVVQISDRELPNASTIRAFSIATVNAYFGPNDAWEDVVSEAGMLSRSIRLTVQLVDPGLTVQGSFDYLEQLRLIAMAG